MKSKWSQVLVFLIALTSMVLYTLEKKKSQSLEQDYALLKGKSLVADFVNTKFSNNMIRIKDFYLAKSDVMSSDIKNQKDMVLQLKDLSKKGETLFFRYSELGCNTCTEEVIELLNTYEIELEYLATYRSKTYLNTFKRMNGIKQEVYNVPIGVSLFPLDSLNIPYFFVADSLGNIVDAHIPIKENLSSTVEFLVQRKYF
jgi:hypothetical protein